MKYDVAIIGAGIVGSCIARELTKYKLSVCILEKESDVACGTSKANSGIIHAGYDPKPETLMAKLNRTGSELYPALARELHFDFKQTGSLVLAFTEEDEKAVNELLERGRQNGIKDLRILNKDELHKMEEHIADEAACALFAPGAAIVSPYQATWAFAENAVQNGAKLFCNTEVHSIEGEKENFSIKTGRGTIECRYIVNAAGLFSDRINKMIGARSFTIKPRRGEYCLLDKNCAYLANHVLFQPPGKMGKGVLVTPTVDGNILVGPSAEDVAETNQTETTGSGQSAVFENALRSVADLPKRNIINSFAGLRALACLPNDKGELEYFHDFIIEEDENIKGFVTCGGIGSPGLSAAPAIGIFVADLLKTAGLKMEENKDFVPIRKGIENFFNASDERKAQLIEENPQYGHIICRCEMITEAEIVAAIKSPVGATDLDGVKRRTRSGMGRCQGGFCSPRVTEIISRELNIPMINVTKCGGNSFILKSKTRS